MKEKCIDVLKIYMEYIHLSKYSRWVPEQNRREFWPETVGRYVEHFKASVKDKIDTDSEVWQEIEQAILNFEVMPSMRALMTAGKALERDAMAGYNPVIGSTKVLTKEYGYVPIKELVDKSCHVLNKNEQWAEAVFHCYGEQDTYTVGLRKNSNTLCNVSCSGNHRWITKEGVVKNTKELKAGKCGDKLPFSSLKRNTDTDSIDYKLGVIHGLIYADGTTLYSQERVKGYHIRICSDISDTLKLFDFFKDNVSVTYPPSFGGDPVVSLFGDFAKTHALKDLPTNETDDYMVGFFRGWFAGDGSVGKNSHTTLCLSEDDFDWFQKYSAVYGYVCQNHRQLSNKTNFGKRKKRSFTITVDRSSLTYDDFVLPRKANKFKPLNSQFTIVSVEKTGKKEMVYCAEVDDTNTFVLEKGLLTGNCSAISITHPRCFDECFYILMCGTGFGFSVERQYIASLPEIEEELYPTDTVLNVRDSKIGWATALKELISMLYNGQVPTWNLDKVRPAGSRLKVFGGRASGPEPLDRLMSFTVRLFTKAKGRKLNSIECHDLICKIADTVIVGSVRRAACISLSNLTDDRMRRAKMGQWWMVEPQRALANNSVAYTEKPDLDSFSKEWRSIYRSKAGERGIINKEALKDKAESTGREHDGDYIVNPCGETILRDTGGLCNLTEEVVRPDDTLDDLIKKVRIATILGTIQATLTDFRYVRKIWKNNAEEERLLGVSLTGLMDHKVMSGTFDKENNDPNFTELSRWLKVLHDNATKTNKKWANTLGIRSTGHVCLVKPSGTVSQLCNTSSGIHPRYAKYYIRRVRNDKKDPLSQLMIDQGIPYIDEGEKYVFEFPIKSPKHSVCAEDLTAIDQLKLWKVYREVWCDGNPSQTIYYTDNEFFIVADWIWNNWDIVGGLSFFPTDDNVYENAPYESINEEMYNLLKGKFPTNINWLAITEYEKKDSTESMQTLACSGGACDI